MYLDKQLSLILSLSPSSSPLPLPPSLLLPTVLLCPFVYLHQFISQYVPFFLIIQTHILIAGLSKVSLLSVSDGSAAAEVTLLCPPVDQPVLGDFTGDGVTDFMLICADRYGLGS